MGHVLTLGLLIGLTAAAIAGATIWLVLSDPVALAEALDGGEVSPLVMQLASLLYDALLRLLSFF